MSTVQVRVSEKSKKNVEKILESLGLDVTTAVRMFFCRIEMEHGLPFPVKQKQKLTVNGFTPEFEAEVLEAMKNPNLSSGFDTAEDVIAYLHSLGSSKQ